MKQFLVEGRDKPKVTFRVMSVPAKALATCVIFAMAFGMIGALAQVIVHDIIPSFYSESTSGGEQPMSDSHENQPESKAGSHTASNRGDLFAELSAADNQAEARPFYQQEQFVWTLKWTHIHLFGMGMIFIFMGIISLLLDAGSKLRTLLIVLPFVGVLTDILAMWLKGFVSPAFFWLHVPGGGVFAFIFGYVSLRALWEMWGRPVTLQTD